MAYKLKRNLLFKLSKLISFCLLITLSIYSKAQTEISLSEAKALYTLEVAKQITWPQEDKMKQFVVGIIGGDESLNKAFKKNQDILIRGKRLIFRPIYLSNFKQEEYAIIFIAKRKSALNSEIFQQAKETLIITEGRINKEEQMISLDTFRDQIKIKLNLSNLSKRGFNVSINLLEFAGTKDDLTDRLREKESALRVLLTEVKNKEDSLLNLNATLTEKSNLLSIAKTKLLDNQKTLEANKHQLDSLFFEIEKSKYEVAKNKDEIDTQKKLIHQKQKELLTQETSVNKLKQQILENRKILQHQISKIENQSFDIKKKQATITNQRSWIIASLIVSIIFFILIHYLLKASKTKQKSNKELQQLNSQLYQLATTDDMTKLFNRRYFLEQSQKEFTRQKRNNFQSVMLMIDIDHFKNINDTYGHNVGDEVIRTVAETLKKSMREYDIVGRFGGEEFAMMLLDCDIQLAAEIAQRMCDKISHQKLKTKELSIQVTVSIGLSQLDKEDANVEQILLRADKALYEAKNKGRNQITIFS